MPDMNKKDDYRSDKNRTDKSQNKDSSKDKNINQKGSSGSTGQRDQNEGFRKTGS